MGTLLLARVLPVVLAVTLAASALAAAGRPGDPAAESARLPDLDQETPSELVITRAGPERRPVYRLGFRSAVRNIGDGALLITATRASSETDTMAADQVIEYDDAPQQLVPGVGELRYVVSADHRHWHLLGFDRYELRRAGGRTPVVQDRKTGFCLGDRYAVLGRALPSAPPRPVHTSRCGLRRPELLGLQQGISVGYGDDYSPNLEGQYLRLTGLRAGRYVLVHRVNGNRRLLELDYGNNAASLLLRLRWRHGEPIVRVLRHCPESARCSGAVG